MKAPSHRAVKATLEGVVDRRFDGRRDGGRSAVDAPLTAAKSWRSPPGRATAIAMHLPPARPRLHELLLERRGELIDRFVSATRSRGLPPEGATRKAIIDHLNVFLDDVAATLRRQAARPASPVEFDGEAARVHGAQRWGIGYDLDGLVREYGVLRRCILEFIEEADADVDLRTFDQVAELLNVGIAEAVDEFLRRKGEALRATREEAVAIVAHDLRGPLQVVAAAAPVLRDALAAPETDRASATKALGSIERATATMDELITGLLDLSRLEAGRLPLAKADHDLPLLLADAAERARPHAENKGVRLAVASLPTGTVHCDRARAQQVLANLLSNAVKFTNPGGAVELAAEPVVGGWRLCVRDTGPGIPPERIPLLFERFWQAPEARHLGTGLGLAIAKGLVEAQDGGIGVESQVGRGSTFFFTLPGRPGQRV